jgi:hypothetical protein
LELTVKPTGTFLQGGVWNQSELKKYEDQFQESLLISGHSNGVLKVWLENMLSIRCIHQFSVLPFSQYLYSPFYHTATRSPEERPQVCTAQIVIHKHTKEILLCAGLKTGEVFVCAWADSFWQLKTRVSTSGTAVSNVMLHPYLDRYVVLSFHLTSRLAVVDEARKLRIFSSTSGQLIQLLETDFGFSTLAFRYNELGTTPL